MSTIAMASVLATAAVFLTAAALADAQTRTIPFQVDGETLFGTLYLPDTFDGTPTDAVVVTGAWTSVEEQMPSTYARALAQRGLIAFTFDFRGWGKSGSLPGGQRFIEDPAAKTADIRAAIELVAAMPQVAKVHGLGICASAGYMLDATRENDMIARVGLVAPWLHNQEIVEAVYGGAEGVAALKQLAAAAHAKGGDVITAAGPEGADGVLMPIGGYYNDPKRGGIAEYDNAWNNAGWDDWLNYHPLDRAGAYDKPLSIIHSDAAAIPQGVRAFVERFTGDATQVWLENVTQFDFYDDPAAVNSAADAMVTHFTG